jgi:hypothetical protein
MTNNCPPHQWDENGAQEGIVLARCLKCDTRQWHATDGNWDTIKECNKRNKSDHLELITLKKETRFMDTSLKKDTVSENSKGVNNDPPTRLDIPVPVETPKIAAMSLLTDPPVPPDIPAPVIPDPVIDPRIARMRLNTGNTERFDKSAQQVIEDVKTMSWTAAFRKNGIPIGSVGRLRRRWEHMGLIAKPQTPEKEPPKTKENKSTRRDYDAEKTEILRDYYGLSLKDFYAKQHMFSGTWTILKKKWGIKGKAPHKSNRKENNTVKENVPLKYLCPYCDVGWSQAEALIQHMRICHFDSLGKPELPLFNEAWGDSVKVAWLHVLEITGIR